MVQKTGFLFKAHGFFFKLQLMISLHFIPKSSPTLEFPIWLFVWFYSLKLRLFSLNIFQVGCKEPRGQVCDVDFSISEIPPLEEEEEEEERYARGNGKGHR